MIGLPTLPIIDKERKMRRGQRKITEDLFKYRVSRVSEEGKMKRVSKVIFKIASLLEHASFVNAQNRNKQAFKGRCLGDPGS